MPVVFSFYNLDGKLLRVINLRNAVYQQFDGKRWKPFSDPVRMNLRADELTEQQAAQLYASLAGMAGEVVTQAEALELIKKVD